MSFEPSPLTANANVNADLHLDIGVKPKFKDSCKCFCCIPFRGVVKRLTPRRYRNSVEIKAEIIKTEIFERVDE